jgi:hypothetical protein
MNKGSFVCRARISNFAFSPASIKLAPLGFKNPMNVFLAISLVVFTHRPLSDSLDCTAFNIIDQRTSSSVSDNCKLTWINLLTISTVNVMHSLDWLQQPAPFPLPVHSLGQNAYTTSLNHGQQRIITQIFAASQTTRWFFFQHGHSRKFFYRNTQNPSVSLHPAPSASLQLHNSSSPPEKDKSAKTVLATISCPKI